MTMILPSTWHKKALVECLLVLSKEKRMFKCPFCSKPLIECGDRPETHVVACALAEIGKGGSQTELAWQIERAYSRQKTLTRATAGNESPKPAV